MGARMDVCKEKGFDAVEPDNTDGCQNRTGFRITYAQQLRYNTFLDEAAHERGLAIAMKNDPDQVEDLVDLYDFAITEDCFEWNWCGEVGPFIDGARPCSPPSTRTPEQGSPASAQRRTIAAVRRHLEEAQPGRVAQELSDAGLQPSGLPTPRTAPR